MKLLTQPGKAGTIIALGIIALALGELSSAEPAKKAKISKIDAVKLTVSGAMKIKVSATGTVPTSGWTEPQLIPSATGPDKTDNPDVVTLNFDFVATNPTGIVSQLITPIAAETTCPAPPAGKTLKVIVHSETNEATDSIKSPLDPK